MGYWIVVAMLLCALAAVVLALLAEEAEADKQAPAAAERTSPALVWAVIGGADATGAGTPNPDRDTWVAQVAAALPSDVQVLTIGATVADARHVHLPRVLKTSPDVVAVWLGVDDLLSGVALDAFETDFAAIVRELAATHCRLIVGNLPDLSRVIALVSGEPAGAAPKLLIERWNAAIARLAAAYGAHLIDLTSLVGNAAIGSDHFGEEGFRPGVDGHTRIAECFQPAVAEAIEAARQRSEAPASPQRPTQAMSQQAIGASSHHERT